MDNLNSQDQLTRTQSAPPTIPAPDHHPSSIKTLLDQLYTTLKSRIEIHKPHKPPETANHAGDNVQDDEAKRVKEATEELEYIKNLFLKLDNLAKTQFQNHQDHAKGQVKRTLDRIETLLTKTSITDSQYTTLCESVEELIKEKPELESAKKISPATINRDHLHRPVHESFIKVKTETSILRDFKRKYDRLDSDKMKKCLLWFSIFPDGAKIKKRALIYVWLAEGLIEKSNQELERAGNSIFSKFFDLGFLDPVIENGKVYDSVKMQSHIRYMLISLATAGDRGFEFDEEGYLIQAQSTDSAGTTFLYRLHSLRQLKETSDEKLMKIESVFNVDEEKLIIKPEWFSKMKNAKLLYLGRWSAEDKEHIEVETTDFLSAGLKNMQKLKLLSLQGVSRITEIPESVSKCTSLEVLDLRACHNLERIDKQIRSLKQLTHLDLTDCHLLENLPKQIASLSSLQVLKGFVIVEHKKDKKYCEFGELSKLKNLRKLKISAKNMSFPNSEHLKIFSGFIQLRKLTIEWGGSSGSGKNKDNAVKPVRKPGAPFGKLEKLDLRSVPPRPAELLLIPENLENLRKLYIRGGNLHGIAEEGEKKWKRVMGLEVIRLKFLGNLDMDWRRFKGFFPGVKYLEIVKCPKLAYFPCSNKKGFWTRSG